MRHRFAPPYPVVAGMAAVAVAAALVLPPTAAHARLDIVPAGVATRAAPSPAGAGRRGASERPAVRSLPLPPDRRGAPRPPAGTGHGTRGTRGAVAESCTPADFAGRTGSALVAYVRASDQRCLDTLFGLSGPDAHGVFQESQMTAVANGFRDAAGDYPGDDSTGVWELMYFQHAGFYVQSNHPADVGPYDAALTRAVEAGLDTFFAAPHAADVSAANGDLLGEAVILTDSADAQGRYLNVYRWILTGYDASWDAYPSMDYALNSVYTPLWRGNWNPDFVAALTADPGIIDTLYDFVLGHRSMLGGGNDVLVSNAGNDLARMSEHAALKAKVRPLGRGLLGASAITGPTANLWVHVAYQLDTYDPAQCAYYGTCDLTAQLTRASLPITHTCGNRTILAQALTAADLTATCASLRGQDPYFHRMARDNGPIPGQHENTIRIAVFGSRNDYAVYSWAIFGNDTDNGGETIIGNPDDPNNRPLSVMYQKPTDDGFVARIWNLNHEYTHYLDARFDMKGDFSAQSSVPDVWWIEGVAEYVSYGYRGVPDDEAIAEAGRHTYRLSTLWDSTYSNSDVTRTYPWGYLAARYMLERHPADVAAMLARFRAGDYAGGRAVYAGGIGTRYNADFDAWLTACAAGGCGTGTR